MNSVLSLVQQRPLVFSLVFCATPYLGLRLYLGVVMHAEDAFARAPSAWFLGLLLGVGAVVPAIFLVSVLRRLVRERARFELRALLEVYASSLLVFAVTYAVLQASGVSPAFTGMPEIWGESGLESAATHVERLHRVFGDALYLSVVTMTTVGYGDIVPAGWLARTFAALQGLLGIGFVGLVLGQYFSSCLECAERDG